MPLLNGVKGSEVESEVPLLNGVKRKEVECVWCP